MTAFVVATRDDTGVKVNRARTSDVLRATLFEIILLIAIQREKRSICSNSLLSYLSRVLFANTSLKMDEQKWSADSD